MARDYAAEYRARTARAREAGFDSYGQYRAAANTPEAREALRAAPNLRGDARYTVVGLASGRTTLPGKPGSETRLRAVIDLARKIRKQRGNDNRVFRALGSPPRKG